MIELDGTAGKARLGANAILGVSLATVKAAAQAQRRPLYRYVGGVGARLLPVPMMNIVNGGAHADNPLDFQEFMIAPIGAPTFSEAVRMGAEVFHTLQAIPGRGRAQHQRRRRGRLRTATSPPPTRPWSSCCAPIEETGYRPGADITICLDPAASEFFTDGGYRYVGEGRERTVEEQVGYLAGLLARYPISSLEDPMAEDDLDGWQLLTAPARRPGATRRRRRVLHRRGPAARRDRRRLRQRDPGEAQPDRHADRDPGHSGDAPGKAGYRVVMSHRSGETEDTTIADLAVAIGCGQIKTGSLSRSDRTAKYNQLIRIEEELGDTARYAGRG